jgi:hypothetical protein
MLQPFLRAKGSRLSPLKTVQAPLSATSMQAKAISEQQ